MEEETINKTDEKKFLHILLGLGSGGAFIALIIFIEIHFLNWNIFGSKDGSSLLINFSVLVYFFAIVVSFIKNRRFIAIGLLSLLIIPLIIFGGCLFAK